MRSKELMITRIVLIRHGETPWNKEGRFQGQSDIGLLPEGIKQAEKLARKFPLNHVDAIYCSDLKRAESTAEPIAERFKLHLQPVAKLREMCFGQWEGVKVEEVNEKWPHVVNDFFGNPQSVDIPDGENLQQVQDRAVAAVKDILAQNKGKNIVIVAHGAVNRAILSYMMHVPIEHSWAIMQSNTAYNVISYDNDKDMFYIETINNASHLD